MYIISSVKKFEITFLCLTFWNGIDIFQSSLGGFKGEECTQSDYATEFANI